MVGYLLTGSSNEALNAIAAKAGIDLENLPPGKRAQRVSRHQRTVPPGKAYPVNFECYHLILEYPNLKQNSKMG